MSNPKALVSDLRDLAKDPDNFRFIINENEVIAGLENFVASPDQEVCTIALNAVLFLSVNPMSHAILAARQKLIESLLELRETSANKSILHLTNSILSHLAKHIDYSLFPSYSAEMLGASSSSSRSTMRRGQTVAALRRGASARAAAASSHSSSGGNGSGNNLSDSVRGVFNSPTQSSRGSLSSTSSRHRQSGPRLGAAAASRSPAPGSASASAASSSSSSSSSSVSPPLARARTHSVLGGGGVVSAPRPYQPKFLKTTVYQIDNMITANDQIQVETAMLKVKGVVSVSCDGQDKRVTVYSSQSNHTSMSDLDTALNPTMPTPADRHEAFKKKVQKALKAVGFVDVKVFDLDEDSAFPTREHVSDSDDYLSTPTRAKPQYLDLDQEDAAFRPDYHQPGAPPMYAQHGGGGAGALGKGPQAPGFNGAASELSVYLTTEGYQNTLEARLARKRKENLEAMRKRNRLTDAMDMVKSFFW